MPVSLPLLLVAACGGSGPIEAPSDELDEVWGLETPAWVDVKTTFNVACALSNRGKLRCWGDELGTVDFQEFPVPAEVQLRSLSLTTDFLCGVTFEGGLWCSGDYIEDTVPEGSDFAEVAVGAGFACGLRRSGGLDCFGIESEELSFPPAGQYSDVEVSGESGVALLSNGRPVAFGATPLATDPPPSGSNYREVASAFTMGCGIAQGTDELECWPEADAVEVPVGRASRIFSGSAYAACAELQSDRSIQCWFPSPRDDRMLSSFWNYSIQEQLPPEDFRNVSPARDYACGVTDRHDLTCWGMPDGPWREVIERVPPVEDGEWLAR